MSPRDSRIAKAWTLIKKRGLRAGAGEAVAAWARDAVSVPQDVVGQYEYVLRGDSPARLKRPVDGPLRINWLIPGLGKGSGGLFNIFRMVSYLERWGHPNRIFVVAKEKVDPEAAKEFVRRHYFPISSAVESFGPDISDSDALIATQWMTAYAARAVGNTAQKFYFVQDLEHLFYPEGSLNEFAKETYRWGFYGITAGRWIAEDLKRNFGMDCTPFGFSFEREWYSANGERRFKDQKKRVLFYARALTERRGFELGMLTLSLVAKRVPDLEVVMVGLRPREIELPFSAVIPGHLAPAELASIYRSCTAALVLSHTNLSLLPLEIMACGCPVVSNSGPNVEWLLNERIAGIARPVPEELANALVELIQNDEARAQKIAAGLEFTAASNWEAEARKVEAALYSGLRQNG
jgi:glycosyltransferase involved in cell wall biosynthesis